MNNINISTLASPLTCAEMTEPSAKLIVIADFLTDIIFYPFSCPGLDQHGPHGPESDPTLAGPHIHRPPAGGVPLHQSADLSRD